MNYDWDFSGVLHFMPAYKRAVIVTINLAVLSSVLGTLLGVPLAVPLRWRRLVSLPLLFVIDIFRAIPNLVLIFFFYYFPYKELLGIQPVTPFTAALTALIVAQAAYSADVFRAAIDRVPQEQVLGLRALGFPERSIIWHVVVPHVTRQTLPTQVAFWIGNLKLSSLAYVIGVGEVVYVAKTGMAQNFRSLEAWLAVALIYIILVLPCAYILRMLEHSKWIRRQ